MQFQIKRCPAPCVYNVDRELYGQQVRAVGLFLDGRHDELRAELEERMQQASERFEFEMAAIYRDQLRAVDLVRQQQRVVSVTDRDQDVVALYREADLVEIAVLFVRSGRVVEAATLSQPRVEVPDDEVVAAFLRDHYGDGGPGGALIPDEIILPVLPEGAAGVAEWLTDRRQEAARAKGVSAGRCQLLAPSRGPRKELLELAAANAQHSFKEKQRSAEGRRRAARAPAAKAPAPDVAAAD